MGRNLAHKISVGCNHKWHANRNTLIRLTKTLQKDKYIIINLEKIT